MSISVFISPNNNIKLCSRHITHTIICLWPITHTRFHIYIQATPDMDHNARIIGEKRVMFHSICLLPIRLNIFTRESLIITFSTKSLAFLFQTCLLIWMIVSFWCSRPRCVFFFDSAHFFDLWPRQ